MKQKNDTDLWLTNPLAPLSGGIILKNMAHNIKNTKNKLSIIFSIIVFVLILGLSISFFSVKYFNELKTEEKKFDILSTVIKSWNLNKIKLMWNRFEESFTRKLRKKDREYIEDNLPDWFVNHIHLDKNNYLVSKFIKEEIKLSFFNEILEEKKYFKTTYEDWFLVKKFSLKNDWNFIIFKKLKYDFEEHMEDIFRFFIISFLFSIFIYFISRKFIDDTFLPVEQNIEDMKNFIHNAWHELKTPISVIDSNLQLLEDTQKFDKSMNKEMRNEIKKLNSLIDSLVNLSDVDSFKVTEKNNLKEILEEIIKEFKDKIKKGKIKVNLDIKDNIFVEANRNYLYIYLSNIVWNAIKYNKKNWDIDIFYKNKELIIKDTWVWIEKKNLDKIFDRFYKVDESRCSDGCGIWLSLVKKIAWVYKWKLKVDSVKWDGSEFRIWF